MLDLRLPVVLCSYNKFTTGIKVFFCKFDCEYTNFLKTLGMELM
jgi:hypothetical protein